MWPSGLLRTVSLQRLWGPLGTGVDINMWTEVCQLAQHEELPVSMSAPLAFALGAAGSGDRGWEANGTRDTRFLTHTHTHWSFIGATQGRRLTLSLPVLHVLPDVSVRKGSVLIGSKKNSLSSHHKLVVLCCSCCWAEADQCFKLHNKTERIQKSVLVVCFSDQSTRHFYSRSLRSATVCWHLTGPL